MREFALSEWERGRRALDSARQLIGNDPDSAASRAYYAAFHAVTALFAMRGQTYSRHSALRAALHRDLVQTKVWSADKGQAFDFLIELREIGDYGGLSRVTSHDASMAVEKAEIILRCVQDTCPELK